MLLFARLARGVIGNSAEDGDFELPLFGFLQDYGRGYEVFYQWVMRVGCFPRVSFSLAEALDGPGPVVVVRPRRPIPPEAAAKAKGFLERGGTLLVLEGPLAPESSAGGLIAQFGLSFGPAAGGTAVEPASGVPIAPTRGAAAVLGGAPLLVTEGGAPLLAFARVGKGMVVAGGLAETFADPAMGGSHRALPDREMRARYEMAFALVRGMAGGPDAIEKEFRRLGAACAPD